VGAVALDGGPEIREKTVIFGGAVEEEEATPGGVRGGCGEMKQIKGNVVASSI
jgi:hypothetical protein